MPGRDRANTTIVIGSGIVGLLIAVKLQEAGRRTIVIDKGELASGASKAALGNLTPYSDHDASPVTTRLAAESFAQYPALLATFSESAKLPIEYSHHGTIELALDDAEAAALRTTFDRLSEEGAPVEWLDEASVARLEPLAARCAAGLFYKDEATLDVPQLLAAVVRHAALIGCTLIDKRAVYSVERDKDGVVVGTSDGDIRADSVVVATGAAAALDGLPALPIRRICGEVVEASGPSGAIRHCLYRGDGFVTPKPDGRVLLGSNYDEHGPTSDECEDTISVRSALQCLSATTAIVPALQEFQMRRVWKSWRPCTPDAQPILHAIDDRTVLALGFFGLGFTLAPAVAKYVSEFVTDGVSLPAELSLSRFSS